MNNFKNKNEWNSVFHTHKRQTIKCCEEMKRLPQNTTMRGQPVFSLFFLIVSSSAAEKKNSFPFYLRWHLHLKAQKIKKAEGTV